jgi:hypothetical protein
MEHPPTLQFGDRSTLEEVRRRFETWRRGGKPGGRIPNCLWQAAVEVCGKHPVHEVARALGLNYNQLKGRVSASRAVAVSQGQGPAGFVELSLGVNAATVPCTLELESRTGAKLKLTFCGVLDPLELARVFWRQGS